MITNTEYASLYYADISKDLDFLEKNVMDYPASSLSQFLLLYHLKRNNDPRFDLQAKQAGIYLHNPYWMEFQLSKLQSDQQDNPQETVSGEPDKTPEVIELPEEQSEDFEVKESENKLPFPVNEQITEILPFDTETSVTANEEFKESEGENLNQNQNELIEKKTTAEELPAAADQPIISNLPLQTEVTDTFVERTNETAILNNKEVEVPFLEEIKEDFENEEKITEPHPQLANEVNISPDEEDSFSKDESVLNIKIPEEQNFSAEPIHENEPGYEEDQEEAIAFEPLHTVDYFASQGIRLSEEALNNDQLGKQVKSFTAWLKSMKKLHPGQLPEQNEVIEKLIQTSSEASNQDANVLTEAMAEVLVKQGKREKAIEMYEKLSLINPSKSAYFAAKIESLNII